MGKADKGEANSKESECEFVKIGYLDCFAGMSSSRFIGALVSAGVPEQILYDAVEALDIGAHLELVHIKRNNIATIRAHISVDSVLDTLTDTIVNLPIPERTAYYELPIFIQGEERNNRNMDQQVHLLGTIQALIENAVIPKKAKELALLTFNNLAEAEAKVCGLPIEEIYFHKVKALNTIVGITVCCVGCAWLEVDQWYASPVNVGSGILKHPQGSLPIPTPTTLELLGNQAVIFASGPQKELLTSTCAALMKSMKVKYTPCPPFSITRIGYGAGRIEYDNLPNFLRIEIGNTQEREKQSILAEMAIIEAELITPTSEILQEKMAGLQHELYEHGAKLVYTLPVSSLFSQTTDKLIISALPDRAEEIRCILFRNLDITYVHWRIEKYDHLIYYNEYIQSPWGKIKVRIGQLLNNRIISITPDLKTCQEFAQKHGISYTQVEETIKHLFISIKN